MTVGASSTASDREPREAFPFDPLPRYLRRDRDAIFGTDFRDQVPDLGIREVLSGPRSPWQRAYMEAGDWFHSGGVPGPCDRVQLAFILLNLPSLTDLNHPERSHEIDAVADLLWFATGGGKTEAYLGLTAYTLALRRRQGEIDGRDGEHGVGVLMPGSLVHWILHPVLFDTDSVASRSSKIRWGPVPCCVALLARRKNRRYTLLSSY